jgi:AcrR family transcriptional regulator
MPMPPTLDMLPRRERERLQRRQAILEAAQAVFAEKGYDAATLDEIADRAEFGKGTLYNYFGGGKEAMLFAIFDDLYDTVCGFIRTHLDPQQQAGKPIQQVFEEFFEGAFRFFQERILLFMILMKEAHRLCFSGNPEKVAYFLRQRERVARELVPTLEAAMQRGTLRALPTLATAHLILENMDAVNRQRCFCDPHDPAQPAPALSPSEAARFLATVLFHGLLPTPPSNPN